eukprot:CAMPEP_0182433526 /NCGR_PEP_ID=MMETSP1167-20130531/63775_1 /TAXON_ID=2988 /ORGANISM="Mallomonas Sp, Strain CCMP3275" /LENGTH=126 /DNA_ID=CAMNT_0024622329 /DNA_START=115 /DNA_END=495 /DNA_ORIENTATION=-
MTKVPAVRVAAAAVMPMVLATQIFKSVAYATNGVLMGGLDWEYSSAGMTLAALLCCLIVHVLPASLWNIWIALCAFMAAQVVISAGRFSSGTGPWAGLSLYRKNNYDSAMDSNPSNKPDSSAAVNG